MKKNNDQDKNNKRPHNPNEKSPIEDPPASPSEPDQQDKYKEYV